MSSSEAPKAPGSPTEASPAAPPPSPTGTFEKVVASGTNAPIDSFFPPMPTQDAFVSAHARVRRAKAPTRALYALLVNMPSTTAPLEERLEWLEQLGRWLLQKRAGHLLEGALPKEDGRTGRLRFLIHVGKTEAAGLRLSAMLSCVLADSSPRLLLLAGASADTPGFWAEASTRLAEKMLPPPPADVSQLLIELFRHKENIAWLELLPEDALDGFAHMIARGSRNGLLPLRRSLKEALTLLSARLAALGLADDFRARCPGVTLEDSPFRRLPVAVESCLTSASTIDPTARSGLDTLIHRSQADIARVFLHLEETGVSIDLVFRLELMTKALERMERLTALWSSEGPVRGRTLLLAMVLHEAKKARSLRELFRSSSRQLARKIVERAGKTGEHYITSSRGEYFKMLVSAGLGGIITVGTIAVKLALAARPMPLFVEGVLYTMNYAGSFLLIQALGATLATKQPAMTAAAIANTLKDTAHGFEDLGRLFARTVRSQIAAAFGNVALVVPGAMVLDVVYRAANGHSYIDTEKSLRIMAGLNPWASGTVIFAAMTGVVLWLSSMAAGWIDNWFTYRRIPEALGRSRTLRRIVGKRGATKFGGWIERNISGIGGNTSLGFFLTVLALSGNFFGFPSDVRHVTLHAGQLALAYTAAGADPGAEDLFGPACLGIAVTLFVNLGVSFALALATAARAREVSLTDLKLFRALFGYALRRPWEFFLPPSGDAAVARAEHREIVAAPAAVALPVSGAHEIPATEAPGERPPPSNPTGAPPASHS